MKVAIDAKLRRYVAVKITAFEKSALLCIDGCQLFSVKHYVFYCQIVFSKPFLCTDDGVHLSHYAGLSIVLKFLKF